MHAPRTARALAAVLIAAVLLAVLLHPGLAAGAWFVPVLLVALIAPALSGRVSRDPRRDAPSCVFRPAAAGRAPPAPLSLAA